MPLALTVRTMDGTLANDRSRGEEAAKGSMPPEHATKETANQKAQPVFLNTTQRPGHVENCPQSEESREERRGEVERREETRREMRRERREEMRRERRRLSMSSPTCQSQCMCANETCGVVMVVMLAMHVAGKAA